MEQVVEKEKARRRRSTRIEQKRKVEEKRKEEQKKEEEKQKKEEEQKEEERREDMEEADNPLSPKKSESVSAPVTHTHRGEQTQDSRLLLYRVKHEGELEVIH